METTAMPADTSAWLRVEGVNSLDPQFEGEVAALFKGTALSMCYQCGVCSGSCPTVDRMTYGPRRIMHMISLGMAERVLRSEDIWYCVSCYSCAARCPQGIEIADVMATLRSMAIAKGLAKDREATFSQAFVKVIERYGRMYEPEVLLRYYAALASPGGLMKQTGLAIRMFRKGKIGLLPERIARTEELVEIASASAGGEGA